MILMVFLALVVAVACGDDDEDGEPTVEATEEIVATEEAEETATVEATIEEEATEEPVVGTDDGTPVSVATPDAVATPGAAGSPAGVASPSVVATPEATPVGDATPTSDDAAAASDVATPMAATPATAAIGSVALAGQVVLPGTVNETFVMAEDGCVGLNGYADMRAGRQLVVRDQTGTIVGVTTLQAVDSTDTCAWDFSLEVPESTFYAVSIPMVVEHILTSDDVEQNEGEITIPLR